MSLINTLNFILSHPLNKNNKTKALYRFLKWQIYSRLNTSLVMYPFATKSKIMLKRGLTGATGNLYCGLDEFEDMSFLLHYLRDSDLFVDIGANVGSYTILAASEVGAKAFSFEPIPSTFAILSSNIKINEINSRVTNLNIGIGSAKGILKFTKSLDTVNHVATSDESDTIDVPIEKFDDIIELNTPALVKIDVEGFETEVIKGMNNAFQNNNLKGIIIELNGSGARYGYEENKIHTTLLQQGFKPYRYLPFERSLVEISSHNKFNTIYLRDLSFAQNRVSTAKKIKIHSFEF